MPTPWDASIKKSKQLTVFPGSALLKSAAWGAALFGQILLEFNKLSSSNKLGVGLVASSTGPAPKGSGGANVQVEASSGSHSFTVEGVAQKGSLGPPPNIFGVTHTVSQGGEIIRAFVFLPISPTVAARGVGRGVRIAVALHELLHACGLEHTDPGHDSGFQDPDLFRTGESLDANFPPDGNPGDRLDLGHGKFAPPFFLTARTAGLVRKNWS